MRSVQRLNGLLENSTFHQLLLALLFFGVYSTERFRLAIGPTHFRYSLLALIAVFLISLIANPRKLFERGLSSPTLMAWAPFLALSAASVTFGQDPKKAALIWAYNAVTLIVCWNFSQRVTWEKLARPLLWALTAHTAVLFWDEFTVAGLLPATWAIGKLYPTAYTYRVTGFYVAPQFYGTAIGLSAWLWLGVERKLRLFSRDSLLLTFVFAGLWLNYSRTAWAMIIFAWGLSSAWLTLKLIQRKERLASLGKGFLWMLGFSFGFFWLSTISPDQHDKLQRKFSLSQTWARLCPSLKEAVPFESTCPALDPLLESDLDPLNSEGRRFSEWKFAMRTLDQSPWLGQGFTPVTFGTPTGGLPQDEALTPAPSTPMRMEYRFESLLALTLCDYGLLGLVALLGGIAWLLFKTANPWTGAAWVAYWIVGSHSSQVFARLDIWLPTFLFLEVSLKSARGQTIALESSGSPT